MTTRLLVLIVSLAACSSGDPIAGGERAACRSDGTCEVGLECWSEVCVRPPSADCGAVAARLAAVTLGNYATDDERRPRIAELRAQCQREHLTAREGQCLVAAADDDALAECPRALLPELDGTRRRCTPLAAQVALMFARGGAVVELLGVGAAAEVGTILVESCIANAWPREVTTCARTATSLEDAQACAAALSPSARRSLERRLERLVMRPRSQPRVPPPDPWATPPSVRLTTSCARYLRLLEAYAACPQIPAAATSSIRTSIDSLKAAWAATPPPAGSPVDDACRQGHDGMAQGMRSLGCAVPP